MLPADRKPWQAHWIDDGPDEKLVFYCPESLSESSVLRRNSSGIHRRVSPSPFPRFVTAIGTQQATPNLSRRWVACRAPSRSESQPTTAT